MALPTTIALNVAEPNQISFLGPFKDGNGNFYAVGDDQTGGGGLGMYKATDPTVSWTRQDAANEPGLGFTISAWATQIGTSIVVEARTDTTVLWAEFRTSDHASADTWLSSTPETVASGTTLDSDNFADEPAGSIAVRAGPDSIVLYQGATDKVMGVDRARVDYARREGGSWTPDIAVDAGGEVDYGSGVAVLGEADKVHFFFTRETATRTLNHRSLNSSNTLGTVHTTSTNPADAYEWGTATYYDDAGVERITAVYGLGTDVYSVEVDDESLGTPEKMNDAATSSTLIAQHLALESPKKVHALFTASDVDLQHDVNDDSGGWGTDVEESTAAHDLLLGANVYDRSGDKLAYLYYTSASDDLFYDEIVLGAAPTPKSLAMTAVGTLVLLRQVEKPLAMAGIGTMIPVKNVGLTNKAFSGVGTLGTIKNVGKPLAMSATGTMVLNAAQVLLQALAMAATGVLTKTQIIGKVMGMSATGTMGLVRQVSKTIAAAATGTLAVVKQVSKTIAAAATGTLAMARAFVFVKALAMSATGTLVLTTVFTAIRALAISATGTLAVALVPTFTKLLSMSATGTVSLVRTVGKMLSMTALGTVGLVKNVGKTIAASAVGTLALQASQLLLKTLSMTATGTMAMVRVVIPFVVAIKRLVRRGIITIWH